MKKKRMLVLNRHGNPKTTALLLFFFLLPLQWTYAQVSMNTGKTTVGSVIEKIQQQTKYKFFYDSAISRTPVNGVKVKNASVNDVLKKVLKDKGISYKMVDNVIYLKHESAPTSVSAPLLLRRRLTVRRKPSRVWCLTRPVRPSSVPPSRSRAPM